MEADAREELRALRARAYGPGADIHEDPVARERLRELEALVQEQARDRADAASPPAAASAEPSKPEGEPDAGREPTSEEPAPEPRSPRRISAGWWAASVVAALAVGAGGAVAVTAVSQGAGGAQVIASLPPEPEVPWPRFLGAETGDSTSFREFYGLATVSAERSWGGPGSDRCLIVFQTVEADMVGSGSGYQWACGTRSFPPSVQFEVGSSNSLPDELRARFPAGTELQFTYVPSPRDDVDAPRIEITEIPPAEDVDAQD
ncbi:hypothetical protein [Microbacterium aurantiacum]|uniref:Uncharacterized protein n=1 Tax=Microbacterium aurantiacum TaxID=162393 RepID=A0AAJ2HIQ6_9MICO|nr:hypothetical protein [Microbacterium aurantiacum]MDS0244773.1 hypothetical protein [Microbacterium aurantiacum]